MRLLVLSDTHGKADLKAILVAAEEVDLVVHLGDGFADGQALQAALRAPMVQVSGNADAPLELMPEKLLELDGKRVLLTHGHRYRVKRDIDALIAHAEEYDADLVLFGHMHRRFVLERGRTTYFNPGSAWKNYDDTAPCAGLVTLVDGTITCDWVDLAEISTRRYTPPRGGGHP